TAVLLLASFGENKSEAATPTQSQPTSTQTTPTQTTPTSAGSTQTTPTQTTPTSTGSTQTTPSAQGDPVAGKQVFQSQPCGGCHTLKDAGTTGNVGPNLDQLKPPYARVAT